MGPDDPCGRSGALARVVPVIGLHATIADTQPDSDGPGGIWAVSCWCGWAESGEYRGLLVNEPLALRHAHNLGGRHESRENSARKSSL